MIIQDAPKTVKTIAGMMYAVAIGFPALIFTTMGEPVGQASYNMSSACTELNQPHSPMYPEARPRLSSPFYADACNTIAEVLVFGYAAIIVIGALAAALYITLFTTRELMRLATGDEFYEQDGDEEYYVMVFTLIMGVLVATMSHHMLR